MNIIVTGYFGSGSSAVLDLLSEYESVGSVVKNKAGGYEHTTFYHPGGIFDLEDKLLKNNDIHRSDEALSTFKKEMFRLNNNNFGWYGSFNTLFGDKFEIILNTFIENLHPFKINARYYGQCEKVIFNPFKIPLQIAARVLLGRTIYVWGRQFIYYTKKPEMNVAFPTEEEYFNAAKTFVKSYMDLFKEPAKENTVFDRLVLCHNLYRVPNYFDDDTRIIKVKRDIRDVYIFNKYLWKKINAGSMYPNDINTFLDYWKRIHKIEKEVNDYRILTINFEDLIYKYEETVRQIEQHCQLSADDHKNKKTLFVPKKSIKNTQVYKLNTEWKKELEDLEKKFPQDLYEFPYDIETTVNEMFDDSRAKKKKGLLTFRRK